MLQDLTDLTNAGSIRQKTFCLTTASLAEQTYAHIQVSRFILGNIFV